MELLVDLGGGVALLLWGVRMVRTAITRAFGADLRRLVGHCGRSRPMAFGAGVAVATVLQSATATALILASFAGRGLIATAPALALLLGADLGATLAAQLLALPVRALAPLLVLSGLVIVLASEAARPQSLGRLVLGLGLMLLALRLIGEATLPLRQSPGLAALLELLAHEPFLALLLAALLTWLAHSTLAIVLLVMSLSQAGLVPPALALPLVLGANLGGALAPVAMTAGDTAEARRAPLGNLLVRASGALLALPLLPLVLPLLADPGGGSGRLVVDFHTGYNLLLGVAALPLVGPLARLVDRLLPPAPAGEDPGRPRHLDRDALDMPAEALACATREALRMGDHVETMLRHTLKVIETDDDVLARHVAREDDTVDALHEAIKLYLAKLAARELDEQQGARSIEILTFTTNLEHAGDMLANGLMELAGKKRRQKIAFSSEGLADIRALHVLVEDSLRRALSVFLSGDRDLARELQAQKGRVRLVERRATLSHLRRLAAGSAASIASSALYLDVLRDLRRVNSHLAAIAYPVLERRAPAAAAEEGPAALPAPPAGAAAAPSGT
ncbi:Na/Pi cotransporter family protein [Geminicoccaceae bacterium 1502E]|nr:Na/Pi cotransporter family protein [Geminicoccaceae bacterium 1502E]